MSENTPEAPVDSPAWAARKVLRAARSGTLATAIDGQPFASLITPATASDGSVLMLLSDLSEHTRHLRTDGRCAVMAAGDPEELNAQTAPRVTVTGIAVIDTDPALKARWVVLHPYAAFYADFGDFHLWRLRPLAGQFIGGFARAHRLRQADLVVDAAAVEAAEADIVQQCNDDHDDALDAIARNAGLAGNGWRMVVCDPDGFDLVREEVVRRISWPMVAGDPGTIRASFVNLAAAAKN